MLELSCFQQGQKLCNKLIYPPLGSSKMFVTQADFLQNGERYIQEHNLKMRHYDEEKSDLVLDELIQLIPKPKNRYSYCSVCRINYEDYLRVIFCLT